MNAVDATDRTEQQDEAEAPSLLTIILDTNPHAWNLLADSLSFVESGSQSSCLHQRAPGHQ